MPAIVQGIIDRERWLSDSTALILRHALQGYGVPQDEASALVGFILALQEDVREAERDPRDPDG